MSGPTSQRNDLQIRQAPAKQDGLDGSYKVRKKDYKKFFRVGRVFSTVWSEGVSGITDTLSRTTYLAAYGERVHSVLRRFVVVRQHDRFCTCLPVSSYRPNGKIPSLGDYGIISSQKPPRAVEGITKKPVHVHLAKGVGPLWDTLVNYARIYTVEMNVKVKDVGDLDPESKRVLGLNFREALAFAIDDEQTFQEPELSGPARPNGFDLSQPSASGTDSLAPFSYSTIDDHFEAEKDYSTLNDVAQDPAKDFSNTSISLALRPPPFANSDYANQVVISMSEPSEHLDPRMSIDPPI
jgi:hypothetical protein